MPRPIIAPKIRLYAKRRIAPNGCWEWMGYINPQHGYGQMHFGPNRNTVNTVHRVSWIIHFGDIPDGSLVLHRCDNHLCFNPEHLFLGTHQDNCDDKITKGRLRHGHVYGKANRGGRRKLTQEDVREIKRRLDTGDGTFKLAIEFGVTHQAIRRIKNGTSWRYVTTTQ